MKKPHRHIAAPGPALARLSATIDSDTLAQAQIIARMSGYRFSFSRYLNDVLAREVQTKAGLLSSAHP